MYPALAGGFFTAEPPGKPCYGFGKGQRERVRELSLGGKPLLEKSACVSIEKFTVPSTVTNISSYAFTNLLSLRELHFQTVTPPTLTNTSIYGLPNECIIYVPRGSLNAYKTAQYWSDYASQIQEEPE